MHLRITNATVINTVEVRPKSLGIQTTFTTNTIDFDLAAPANISVEVNGDITNPLFVFANPLEGTTPTPGDPNVIFFASGQVYNQGETVVSSGKTVYVEGGAYVKGRIRIGTDSPGGSGSSDVIVLGRGVMDATTLASVRPARIFNSSSVTFDGPVFLGSSNFGVAAFASTNLTFKNIKILNKDLYGDGLDVVGCTNVTIDSCFIRSVTGLNFLDQWSVSPSMGLSLCFPAFLVHALRREGAARPERGMDPFAPQTPPGFRSPVGCAV